MSLAKLAQGFGRSAPEPVTALGAACEATLPSSTAADRLVSGDPWAIPAVVMSTVLRGGLIAGGLYVAGLRGKDLAKGAVGGALAIETFVLGYVAAQRLRGRRGPVTADLDGD